VKQTVINSMQGTIYLIVRQIESEVPSA